MRLPRERRREVDPPSAAAVEAALACCAARYRLPLLVLEATGLRVGELEAARWADLDERGGRLRVSAATAKTGRARWAPLPPDLLAAVAAYSRARTAMPMPDLPRRDPGAAANRPGPGVQGGRPSALRPP